MDDMYRQLNQQHHAMLMEDYDREIREAERRAQQEQIDEISKGVLANLSKEGSKAVIIMTIIYLRACDIYSKYIRQNTDIIGCFYY